jgi:P-type Cu2+ transporter
LSPVAASCFHCGAEIPAGVVIEQGRAGADLRFCCHGCQGAYLLISGAGLAEFYRRRDWRDSGPATGAYRSGHNDEQLSRFVYAAGNGSAIDIIIGGIRCASCVWLNERIVGKIPGVQEVRVNHATGRARVLFDGSTVTPAAIFSRISAIGYAPRPYTPTAAIENARREQRDLLVRFGTAFFLTMQLMAYSFALYAGYFQGMEPTAKSYLQLFSLIVTTPVVFYCGAPFLSGAWRGMANRSANMELLIAIGALSSYGYSLYGMLTGGEVYFETAAMIVALILAGRLLENAARRRAAGGVERLLGLCAGVAHRVRGESVEETDPSQLAKGDLILVAPGERFPVDGELVSGESDVDESPATGEAEPVLKRCGDRVIAGSANLTGEVRVLCERKASQSFVARVARLVEEAQSRRAPIQKLSDRVSAIFVPCVLSLAALTLAFHLLGGDSASASVMSGLAVVVIACPCALGLATPTAVLAGTGAAAARGVIFKGGDVLERLSRVDHVVFDKTGTLTCGTPELIAARPVGGVDAAEMLAVAAAVETGSLHPFGKAIANHAAGLPLAIAKASDVKAVAGGGVVGTVGGEKVAVGSARFLKGLGVTGCTGRSEAPTGSTVVCVARAGKFCGSLILKDRPRPEAARVISYFTGTGIRPLLFSGDRGEGARELAAAVGIAEGIGEMSPAEKAKRIEALRQGGGSVLMVGDGINDAPALSAADVGCAVSGGTDIAIDTSDLVLVKPDLERLVLAHQAARRTMKIVRENLVWAFCYNAAGIPLAMTGRLTPVYAAGAMAVSSLCVVCNSLRLARGNRWNNRW